MGDTPLASLSLTHVSYDASDPISYLAAWLSLLPQALCVTYVTLLWATREVEVAMMFAGQMGCEALNFGLKRLIKEERPKQMLGKGYGMPSSHAQFLAFFATYLTLFLLLRHRPAARSSRQRASSPSHAPAQHPLPLPSYYLQIRLLVGAVLLTATSVAASRVYLHYHTPKQVLAGVGAGVIAAGAWFLVTGLLRNGGVVDALLQTALVRQFRIRDLVCSEDLAEAGWREWEAQRRSKPRTKAA